MTCEDCALLRVELEIAGVFVVCLALLAGVIYVALRVQEWRERRRQSRSSGTS